MEAALVFRSTIALRPVAAGAVLAVLATALVALGGALTPASASGRTGGVAPSSSIAPSHPGTFVPSDVTAAIAVAGTRTHVATPSSTPETDPESLGLAAILPDRTPSVAPLVQVAAAHDDETAEATSRPGRYGRAPPNTTM
jgi:hypothetical protein